MNTPSLFVAFYFLAIVFGTRAVVHGKSPAPDLLVPVALAWCLASWAVADARRRRHPIPLFARQWFLLLAVLLVPGYVIWSRRWAGLGWVVVHTVLWYVLVGVSLYVAALLIHGQNWRLAIGR